jgi:hypothetical protein
MCLLVRELGIVEREDPELDGLRQIVLVLPVDVAARLDPEVELPVRRVEAEP